MESSSPTLKNRTFIHTAPSVWKMMKSNLSQKCSLGQLSREAFLKNGCTHASYAFPLSREFTLSKNLGLKHFDKK